ncbi:MAG: MoxR family ATPase, partial [Planctomycetota bacterium]|nr:MoxR family ATPase [Planctomycetota bacterium]
QEGTYPLPEAQLDRFFFKLEVGYSSREELAEILDRTTTGFEAEIEPVIDGPRIRAHQELVRRVGIEDSIRDYAVRMVLSTHPQGQFATPTVNRFLRFGASPRAAQTLVLAGKVRALLDGRNHVGVEDVRSVAVPALRHRCLLNFEGEAEGVSTEEVIRNIVETLPTQASLG